MVSFTFPCWLGDFSTILTSSTPIGWLCLLVLVMF
nr:MAG TPA: hypothetical protein [Bacteriophage sp.]